MITGQVQSIVFDGTQPYVTSLVVQRGSSWPWLVQLTDVSGRVVDMSPVILSGTVATPWGFAFGIAQDFGAGGELILTLVSSTATAAGSQITLPGGGTDGEVLVYIGPDDATLLPSPEALADPGEAYCVFSFVATDPSGISYVVSRGVLYPQEFVNGSLS